MALSNTFLMAILTQLSQQLVAQAETIVQHTSNNGSYYVVQDTDNDHLYTWPIAQELCQSLYGTSLASIHSSSQYTEVYSTIDSIFKPFGPSYYHRLWIGLSDQITEGDYVWNDGTNYDYTLPLTFSSTSTTDCLYFQYRIPSIQLLSQSCTSATWSQFVCNAVPLTNKPTTESPTDSPTEQPSNASPTSIPTTFEPTFSHFTEQPSNASPTSSIPTTFEPTFSHFTPSILTTLSTTNTHILSFNTNNADVMWIYIVIGVGCCLLLTIFVLMMMFKRERKKNAKVKRVVADNRNVTAGNIKMPENMKNGKNLYSDEGQAISIIKEIDQTQIGDEENQTQTFTYY